MLDAQRINEAREKAGRLIALAAAKGAEIRERLSRNEPVGELNTEFDTLRTESADAITELNRLEAMQEVDATHARFSRPASPFTGRGGEENLTPEQRSKMSRDERRAHRRQQIQVRHQREMFARAGVNERNFDTFRVAHSDAFLMYCLEGYQAAAREFEGFGFKPTESMALLSTSGELGGFLVSDDVRNEILRDLAGQTVMRRLARVIPTASDAVVFPIVQSASTDADMYTSSYAGSWRQQNYGGDGSGVGSTLTIQNQPRFGQVRIPVHSWAPDAVVLTPELIQDARADVEGIVGECIVETLGIDEDAGFLNGSGVNQPIGLLTTLSGLQITGVNSGVSGSVTYAGLVNLFTNTPAQYRQNGKWLMNSLTYGAIMLLAGTTNDHPLFPVNAPPNTLFGKGIEFSELMPTIAAAASPIIFGDFKYYGIADRQELRVQRLVEKYAPNVGVLPSARVGGQILRTAAFRRLVCS